MVVKLYLLKVFFDWFDCWRFVDFKIIGKLPEFDHLLAQKLFIWSYTIGLHKFEQILPKSLLGFTDIKIIQEDFFVFGLFLGPVFPRLNFGNLLL